MVLLERPLTEARKQLSASTGWIFWLAVAAHFAIFAYLAKWSLENDSVPGIWAFFIGCSAIYLTFIFSLPHVYVDDEYLYLEKFGVSQAVSPQQIKDVRWSKIPGFMVIEFNSNTKLGTKVVFEPSGGRRSLQPDNTRGDDAFESLGKLCGWRHIHHK